MIIKQISNNFCILDKTPPLIHGCPNSINLYSNRSSYGTYYDWVSPTVTDNLDALVELKQVMGPKPGSFFSEYQSPYTISYTATDSSGNIAIPCTFIIYVSRKSIYEFLIFTVIKIVLGLILLLC